MLESLLANNLFLRPQSVEGQVLIKDIVDQFPKYCSKFNQKWSFEQQKEFLLNTCFQKHHLDILMDAWNEARICDFMPHHEFTFVAAVKPSRRQKPISIISDSQTQLKADARF